MIVKVNKKGGDCNCNKKLAKGGCAPKKKKIKKNKNGGLLAIDDIPMYQGGTPNGIYPISRDTIINVQNHPKTYEKKISNGNDRNAGYFEKVVLFPQITEHGIVHKKPTIIGQVDVDQRTGVADSTLKYLPTGNPNYEIVIPKTIVAGQDTIPNPAWNGYWSFIDEGKQTKRK